VNKKNIEIVKQSKKILLKIFGYIANKYFIYTEIGFPNSVISSNNLAAWVIQINTDKENVINKKILKNSKKK
tara:strand:+ start:505 stop:720 length:216 start_codon:yes stop_codon:yes gene_type:complete